MSFLEIAWRLERQNTNISAFIRRNINKNPGKLGKAYKYLFEVKKIYNQAYCFNASFISNHNKILKKEVLTNRAQRVLHNKKTLLRFYENLVQAWPG